MKKWDLINNDDNVDFIISFFSECLGLPLSLREHTLCGVLFFFGFRAILCMFLLNDNNRESILRALDALED